MLLRASKSAKVSQYAPVKEYLEKLSQGIKESLVDRFVSKLVASSGPLEPALQNSAGVVKNCLLKDYFKNKTNDALPLTRIKPLFAKNLHPKLKVFLSNNVDSMMSLLADAIPMSSQEFSNWVAISFESKLCITSCAE
eukprot:TRINITY_DN6685_c0_g2_i1.p1 TRINITY_DN6685_c0_g2~~TRINITY_DN6685_c0_g2_i1.p1  ORF type:complete len:138 (-),score=22.55 TRINITY_DN6685_c0_g2_i1:265-678(-)